MPNGRERAQAAFAVTNEARVFSARSDDVARAYLLARIAVALSLAVSATALSLVWQWTEGLIIAAITIGVAVDGTWRLRRRRSPRVDLSIYLDITATAAAIVLTGLPDVVLVAPLTFQLVSAVLTLTRRSSLFAAAYAIAWTIALFVVDSSSFGADLDQGQLEVVAGMSVVLYLGAMVLMTTGALSSVEAHRLSQEELHAKKTHLQAVVDNLSMVLFAIDNDGYFTLSEGSALPLIGLTSGEAVGLHITDLYDDPLILGSVKKALASDDRITTETQVEGVFFSTEYSPMYDAAGRRTGVVGVSINDTEQVQARKALEELVQSKDEFIASVSHELRTPLTVVYGLGEELRDNAATLPAKEVAELHHLLAQQAGEVVAIVEDLLVAARADIDRIVVVAEPIDVGQEIAKVLGAFATDDRIEVIEPPNTVAAWCDHKRFRQIMRNLVSNALRHGGSTVRVQFSEQPDEVIVEVTDDGAGVAPGSESKVFEAYERARADIGTPASIGLGLTVSRHLARLMGGDVTYLRNEQLSIFRLTLPRSENTDG